MSKIARHNYISDVSIGSIVGINVIISCLSFAGLVFPGPVEAYLAQGFLAFMLGAVLATGISLIYSKIPFPISSPPHQIIAVLALLSTAITRTLLPTMPINQIVFIIFFVIAITTFLTGMIFFILGHFNLGNIIRYIPYPVSSGFMAGTGWLVCKGAINLVSDAPINRNNLIMLLQLNSLETILITIAWSIITLALYERYKKPTILATSFVLTFLLFYLMLMLRSLSFQDAVAHGWMITSAPLAFHYQWFPIAALPNFQVINMILINNIGLIFAAVFVSTIVFFLNLLGLELVLNKDISANKELQLAGVANILAGSLGWLVSFPSLTNGVIAKKGGGKTKLVGIVVLFLLILTISFGLPVIKYVPKILLSCLLMFYGLSMLYDVFFRNAYRFSLLDFLNTIFIFFVIILFGLLSGILLGLLLAIILFVVKYSKINVVGFSLRGKSLQSHMDRPPEIHHALKQKREKIIFLKLDGYIFFGTANNLYEVIRKYFHDEDINKPLYLILDFEFVNGLDSSAMLVLLKIKRFLSRCNATLILTKLPSEILQKLQHWMVESQDGFSIKFFENNDLALAWCEEEMLEDEQIDSITPTSIKEQISQLLPGDVDIDKFMKYIKHLNLKTGEYLIHQNDASNALYFIEYGEIDIVSELSNGQIERLRRLGPGNIVGEMGMFSRSKRTATAIAAKDSSLYRLSKHSLIKMQKYDIRLAHALELYIIKTLSHRLEFTSKQKRLLL